MIPYRLMSIDKLLMYLYGIYCSIDELYFSRACNNYVPLYRLFKYEK